MRREFREESSYDERLERYVSPTDDVPRTDRGKRASLFAIPLALARVVVRSSLPFRDKMSTLFGLAGALPARYVVGRRGPTS